MARATAATWQPAAVDAAIPRTLAASLVLAALVVVAALVLRAGGAADGLALGTALLPLLFGAGGICSGALLRRRWPTGAWLATVAAAGIAAIEVVGLVRSAQAEAALPDWPVLVSVAEGALVVAAAIAAVYAVRDRGGVANPWIRVWQVVCVVGLASVIVAVAWAIAEALTGSARVTSLSAADVDVWPVRLSGRIAAGVIAVATLGGALRDVAPSARRAWTRAPSLQGFARAFGDELLPTSAAMRRRGEEDERARLAADLHARVLPDLRRAAAAAAEGGGAAEPVTAGLRQAIEDVEQLMHSRQSVVLEEYGLVAALEWLAERTEARSRLEVAVELDGASVDDPAAVPKAVARAAFRVALLAIDNVARHANASRVLLRLIVDPQAVELAIADDGQGFDGDTAPRSGRGLIDMRTAANAVGATITVESVARGTRIGFRWPRAANSATAPRDSTGGPRTSPS